MPFPDYALSEFPGSVCNASSLHAELVAGGVVGFGYVTRTGNVITVVCDPEPSSEDQAAIDTLVAAHDGTPEEAAVDFQLVLHPADSTKLIVVDENGEPVAGKTIVVGEAEIKGDSSHDASKGPVLKSPDGTKFRLKIADDGTISTEEV